MRTPWQLSAVVALCLVLGACSWNPFSWGGSSAKPCFYKQGGEPTGDCAPQAVAPVDDDGETAHAVLTASATMSAMGERLSAAALPAPKVIAAFNAIGNSAALMEPRVFEPEREPVNDDINPAEDFVVLMANTAQAPSSEPTVKVYPVPKGAAVDRFTGIIRVVRPGMPTGAVVPIPSGNALTAMVLGASEPQNRNFQLGVASTGAGSARLRMLLTEAASGSTTGTSGVLRYRTTSSSSSQEQYEATPENRAQANAARTNRLTAVLSNEGSLSSTRSQGTGSLQGENEQGASSTADTGATTSSSSSRPSILERLRAGRSSSSSRPSILDRLGGSSTSTAVSRQDASSRGTTAAGGGTTTDDGWTPRGTLVRTGGNSSSSDTSVRGTLVSGNGTNSSDDWTPQGTLIRTGGQSSSDSSFTPVQREHCPRNRSLIGALFTDDSASVGQPGWTFPGLINGDCPMGIGVLKINDEGSPFGSMNF